MPVLEVQVFVRISLFCLVEYMLLSELHDVFSTCLEGGHCTLITLRCLFWMKLMKCFPGVQGSDIRHLPAAATEDSGQVSVFSATMHRRLSKLLGNS